MPTTDLDRRILTVPNRRTEFEIAGQKRAVRDLLTDDQWPTPNRGIGRGLRVEQNVTAEIAIDQKSFRLTTAASA